jgi:hypothetical protein
MNVGVRAGSLNGASAEGRPDREPAGAVASLAANGRPEIVVGAAFAGGLVLAILLRRLAR